MKRRIIGSSLEALATLALQTVPGILHEGGRTVFAAGRAFAIVPV